MPDKVRENRLRRMATRRGLVLEKSRRRDPGALDYGGYRIVRTDTKPNTVLIGHRPPFAATLDDVERFFAASDAYVAGLAADDAAKRYLASAAAHGAPTREDRERLSAALKSWSALKRLAEATPRKRRRTTKRRRS